MPRPQDAVKSNEVNPTSTEWTAPPAETPAGLPTGASLPRQVAALAIWPFLEQIMSFMVGFVDTALAGHLSVEVTNAVGVSSYVMWLMGMLVGSVGVSSTALIARAVGGGAVAEAGADGPLFVTVRV